MILGQISYSDCVVFLILLIPALIADAGFFVTALWVMGALPQLLIKLPYQFARERFFTERERRSPFAQRATAFQDIVIRYVRYAFAKLPAKIGRVFFSKKVALPFLRFRMLRHGYLNSPFILREVKRKDFQGVWIITNAPEKPDVVIYYCHGGGFSMGSSYFYMEFLQAWVSLLKDAGFENPALFALEYTLVPDAVYPTQVLEVVAGYKYILSVFEEPSRICVSGDSAGATLVLSLLLRLSDSPHYKSHVPGLATLISPWVVIKSDKNKNTTSDYLDADALHIYGSMYAGASASLNDSDLSPGRCRDPTRWTRATPTHGWSILLGSEEVFAPETRELITQLTKAGVELHVNEALGGIHAWPVASLYLGESREGRLRGLRDIVEVMRKKMLIVDH